MSVSHKRKLNKEEVQAIREEYNKTGVTIRALGKRYGMSVCSLYRLIHHITYRVF